MMIIVRVAITISVVFYLYFIINLLLINHYREPIQSYEKGPTPYELFLVIPVLNEEHVISRMITQLTESLEQLPPTVHAQIIAVDDDSTDHSLLLLTQSSSRFLQILHRTGNQRAGKGAVLNTAVQYIHKTLALKSDPQRTIVGVLDADAFMNTADLTRVLAHFEQEPQLAMIQTSVNIYNQPNWLTKMQNFEFMGVNNATQQLRNRLGQGIASGNGQFVRLDLALQNPWGNSLLEDLEFTLRTWLLGGTRTAFDHTLVVQQEAVEQLRPFFRQRVRWCQGAVQCMRYLPALWRSGRLNHFQKLDTTFWILMPISGCIVPLTSLITLVVLVSRSLQHWQVGWHHLAIGTLLVIAFSACLVLAALYQRNCAVVKQPVGFMNALKQSLSFQAFLLIISLTPYVAIYRQLRGQTAWAKTRHGVTTRVAKYPDTGLKRSY
ncbi:glycosyltransferase family 2 protein [Lactiplantibacillus plantarum]|uniref:glycosyltransferase family 2 protein n=1 Tax=Lactiplantibacillus plantarum TaxID=1590 RepID=UPI003BA0590E